MQQNIYCYILNHVWLQKMAFLNKPIKVVFATSKIFSHSCHNILWEFGFDSNKNPLNLNHNTTLVLATITPIHYPFKCSVKFRIEWIFVMIVRKVSILFALDISVAFITCLFFLILGIQLLSLYVCQLWATATLFLQDVLYIFRRIFVYSVKWHFIRANENIRIRS